MAKAGEKLPVKNQAFADLLNKRGKGKSDVARKLKGISAQLLGQYEQGRQKPKPDFFVLWESVFNEDIRHLFGFETNVSYTKKAPDIGAYFEELENRLRELEANFAAVKEKLTEIESRMDYDPGFQTHKVFDGE